MTTIGLELTIDALGTPVPQGSKKAFIRGKRVVLVEANTELPAWRKQIIEHAQAAARLTGWVTLTDACWVSMSFWFPRPKTVKRRYPSVPPDEDKLVRAVFDSLKLAGVIADDGLVVEHHAYSRYAETGQHVGVRIRVRPMTDEGMLL